MELRPKEDNPQEQRHHTDTISLTTHVLNKTKLMLDWLRGQARQCASGSSSATNTCNPISLAVGGQVDGMPHIDGLNDQIIACAVHESNVGYVLTRKGYSFTSHPFAPHRHSTDVGL